MKRMSAVLVLAAVLSSAQEPQQSVNEYPMLGANRIYNPGQQIKVGESHGVYTGLIQMDEHYFLRPVLVTETRRQEEQGFLGVEGSLSAYVRHATSGSWQKMAFSYACDDRELKVGQIELARIRDGNEMLIGSHNAVCSLKPVTGSLRSFLPNSSHQGAQQQTYQQPPCEPGYHREGNDPACVENAPDDSGQQPSKSQIWTQTVNQPSQSRSQQDQQEWMAIEKVCGQLGPVLRTQQLSEKERVLYSAVFHHIVEPVRQQAPLITMGVSHSKMINAFTFPLPNQKGGVICLTDSMIDLMGNEDELASVVAHEVGHALDREPPCPYNPAYATRKASISLLTNVSREEINEQRTCEKRADEIGFNLLVHAGYNPYAAGGAFGRQEMFSGDIGTGFFDRIAKMNSNHPITPDRIRDISRVLENYCQSNPGRCQ